MEELLREAQKIYIRTDEEKQKQKAKIMLSTKEQMIQNKVGLQIQGQGAPQGGCQKGQYPKGQPRKKGKNVQIW
jgi:hypothetical protein